MFARLGSWCARRRGTVVVAWLLTLIVLGSMTRILGSDVKTDFDLPNVESRSGFEVLDHAFGGVGGGWTGTIVFHDQTGFDDPTRAAIDSFLKKVDDLPRSTVTGPFGQVSQTAKVDRARLGKALEFFGSDFDPSALAGDKQVSDDGKTAYANVELPADVDQEALKEFSNKVEAFAPQINGVQIEYGGQVFTSFEPPASEMLGVAFAIVILIAAFGSVLAMGLPISVALAGIGVGSTLVLLISNVMSMPDFATQLGMMIGLGVGIDYALFIVTRYREQVRVGHTVPEAISIAIDTSGRAVMFAGITVVISMMGMLIMGIAFVNGLAVGSATVVLVTMIASLTLLPALLAYVGERIEVTRWRGLIAAGLVVIALLGMGFRAQPMLIGLPLAAVVLVMIAGLVFAPLKKEVPPRRERPLRETTAYRWSRVVQSHPWPMAIGAALVLLILAIPVTSLRLAFSDDGNRPADSSNRKAYDLLAKGFGPGSNGPLIVVAEIPPGTTASTLAPITKALTDTSGVQSVSGPMPNVLANPDAKEATAVLWTVIPSTTPQSEATTKLVHNLRNDVLPTAEQGPGVEAFVTGFVAVTVDFSDYLAERLPYFFAAVLTLSFLLLMVVFRSLLVPLKAVIMNLLSIGAAYGLMVAVFQWGWAKTLFGIEAAPVEPFLPMVMFAIIFGLSMDYEVFLLSRIHEEWVRTGDSRASVADGLAATAKVITAAAAIMVFVFGSFLLAPDRVVKLMGFGLAIAVLIDATIVRMLLVPATMELLGDRNWWLPRWLDRIIPHVDVEGRHDDSEPDPDDFTDGTGGEDREPELV